MGNPLKVSDSCLTGSRKELIGKRLSSATPILSLLVHGQGERWPAGGRFHPSLGHKQGEYQGNQYTKIV